MGIVTTIIDALRRIGTPTQKSAIERLDAYVSDRRVIDERTETLRSELGSVQVFVARVEPEEEAVTPLSADELASILANADRVDDFLEAFAPGTASEFFLDRLDEAFARWINATDLLGYSGDDVVAITGAAFGRFCVDTLGLEWVEIVDQYGRSVAVEKDCGCVRCFPFDAVAKRIPVSEWGFFKAIYIALQVRATEVVPTRD